MQVSEKKGYMKEDKNNSSIIYLIFKNYNRKKKKKKKKEVLSKNKKLLHDRSNLFQIARWMGIKRKTQQIAPVTDQFIGFSIIAKTDSKQISLQLVCLTGVINILKNLFYDANIGKK